jgi:gamma-glutamylcyclotransferase (GGCT)/AIG2-like uncharacterized protein YtfP
MCDSLFVYGTLRPAARTAWSKQLLRAGRDYQSARMAGVLYDLGRYPGMVHGGSAWVYGEVVRLRDPETILQQLDAYEGREFKRVRARAITRSRVVGCWVYVYDGPRCGSARIPGGDYLFRLADNENGVSSHRSRRPSGYGCLRYIRRSAY